MTDKKSIFNLLAENSYHLHKILEHASALNAGDYFNLEHDEKENFLKFIKEQILDNSKLVEAAKNGN